MVKDETSRSALMIRIISLFTILFMLLCAQLHAQVEDEDALLETLGESAAVIDVQHDDVSDVTNVVCPFKMTIDYEVGRVKCGLVTVPENRDKLDSRKIRLLFAHIVASGRLSDDEEDEANLEVRDDPVVYLTGGPGVNLEPYVSRFLNHDLTKTRDLYILNQRGIGDSGEVCPFYSLTRRENLNAVTLPEIEAETATRTKACFDAAKARGIDVTAYNTVENARDVRALRQALGFQQWNVWGISYGSHLGQMLTQVDKDGIRALVLDAIVPNDLGDLMRIHRWVARNHALIFDECERQQASICDGLKKKFFAAIDSLIDESVMVEAIDEELYPAGNIAVPPLMFAFAPFAMQYEQKEHPAIPSVMLALSKYAEQRDQEVFQAFTAVDGPFSGMSEGMGSAIRCNDGYMAAEAAIAAEDLNEDFGFKQGVFTVQGSQMMADMCVEAGLPPRDRSDYQPVNTDIPTLIVNGDWDPITPPALAERIAPGFANGRLIIVPYAGHGPTRSMSECGGQVMSDFFDDPTQDITALDASCLEKGVEPPEFQRFVLTGATLRLLTRFYDNPKRLIVPGVIVTLLVLIVLSGFIAIIIGYIARRLSSQPDPYHAVGPFLPRLLGLATAFLSLLGLGLIGAGVAATINTSEISIIAGIAPPARSGAVSLLLAIFVGVATIFTTLSAHRVESLRRRTIFGLPLLSISAILLTMYLMFWGITVL